MDFLDLVARAQAFYPDLPALESSEGREYLRELIDTEVRRLKGGKYPDFFGPDYWGIGGDLLRVEVESEDAASRLEGPVLLRSLAQSPTEEQPVLGYRREVRKTERRGAIGRFGTWLRSLVSLPGDTSAHPGDKTAQSVRNRLGEFLVLAALRKSRRR